MNTINTIITDFKNAKVGQLVAINDVDLLIELDGKTTPNYTIKAKSSYESSPSHYIILTLDHIGSDAELLLVCSSFKGACDVKLYSRPDFFEPDKRSVINESDNDWLFDNEGYPEEVYNGDIVFKKKFQNEIFDNTCIVEWETDAKIIDYQLLLIETGFQHEGGGWVDFYSGRQIQDKDVVF
jgi:hypothetical protein